MWASVWNPINSILERRGLINGQTRLLRARRRVGTRCEGASRVGGEEKITAGWVVEENLGLHIDLAVLLARLPDRRGVCAHPSVSSERKASTLGSPKLDCRHR